MSTLPFPDFSSEFASLTPQQQAEVMAFVQRLKSGSQARRAPKLTGEARRRAILELAGSISPEDAELMRKAIEEDCEQIDADGW